MTTETNDESRVPMMACLGGPLNGRDMPLNEPDEETTAALYPDIYYEDCIGGAFYQKVKDAAGNDICHWYAPLTVFHVPGAKSNTMMYTYRGVLPEDAIDYTTFETTATKFPDFN